MLKGDLIIDGRFEWWSDKEAANIKNHHYSFKDIEKVFDDPYFFEIYDEEHSSQEQDRYFGLGCVMEKFLVLQVSYTDNGRTHIITARDATSQERQRYFERLRELYR